MIQRGDAGILLGFDGGEWGGSLRSYSERGALQSVLLESNVVAILPAFDEFVVLTYLGHGMDGRAVEVRERGGRFEVGTAVELPEAPDAGVVDSDGTVLLLTGKGLLRLSRDFALHRVLDEDWWMSSPTSLTLSEHQTAYVGMRGAVVEVQLSTSPPTQTWLYPF